MTYTAREVVQEPPAPIRGTESHPICRPARLNHLQALEAESIYILREAAAEFARPVMLYSIGKDSSVMLRLAQKAFYPGKIPFPLLHIDTSYKFPEMIEFRQSGEIYVYFEVPPEEHKALLAAESKGNYLNRVFKQRNYRYTVARRARS